MDYKQFLTEDRLNKFISVLNKRQETFTVVFENIIDPHNLSACLRSCESTGIYKINLVYDGSQPYPKLSTSSSSSATKWVETTKYSSISECYKKLKDENFKIYSTALNKNSKTIYEIDFTEKVAVVLGNEHSGCSIDAINQADENIIIPQIGMIQSLNISVACAIIVYEMFRQRLNKGMFDNRNISEEEFNRLLNKWTERQVL